MKDRVIVGATSAIAQAVAKFWARRGDRLTLIGRDGDRLAAIALDLQQRGASQVEISVMDFSDPQKLWQQVEELFQEKERVDTLLVALGTRGIEAEAEASLANLQQVWSVNFEAVATIILAAKNHFVKNNHGTIAAFSALDADAVDASNYYYASASAALKNLMSGLRLEFSSQTATQKVIVTTIRPARVDTPIHQYAKKSGRFWISADQAAHRIALGMDRGGHLYLSPMWMGIAALFKVLPISLASKLPR